MYICIIICLFIYTGWATLESSIIAFQEIVRGYGKLFPVVLSNNYNIENSSDSDNASSNDGNNDKDFNNDKNNDDDNDKDFNNNKNNDDDNDKDFNNNKNNDHDNDKDFKNENTTLSYNLNNIFELLITIASTHLNRYIRESVFNFIRILCDPFIRISGEVYDIKNDNDDNNINGDYYSKYNDDNNDKNINDKIKNTETSATIPLKNTNLRKKNVYGEVLEYDANQSEIIVEALVLGTYSCMYMYMYICM
jgi:hypothetical protein